MVQTHRSVNFSRFALSLMKNKRSIKTFDKLLAESLAIEAEEAKDAGKLGFMCRAMAQATMPHRKTDGAAFTRTNGAFTLSMLSPPKVGLPYGSVPRLLVAWLTTEAVRTGQRELELGHTLSEFMRALEMVPTGGRWGSIPRLRSQMQRLFSSSVSCTYTGNNARAGSNFTVADSYSLWWHPQQPDQAGLWSSKVQLSERFFAEVSESPVPIDMRAMKALRRSPMALDIYTWLSHRLSYLKRPTVIPWIGLQAQFGADYGRVRDFRRKFIEQLAAVHVVYPDAKVEPVDDGLKLRPSKTHVPRLKG
jgi:hypothetical protein